MKRLIAIVLTIAAFVPLVMYQWRAAHAQMMLSTLSAGPPGPPPFAGPGPQLVACTAQQTTGGTSISLQINVLAGQSLIAFRKGISSDPGVSDTWANNAAPDTWTNFAPVGNASSFCDNFDYVTTPSSTGSVTGTFPAPNPSAYNGAVLCTVSGFQAPDVGGGIVYASGVANAQTGTTNPGLSADTLVGNYWIETTGNLTGVSSNYAGTGTPFDITLGGSPSNGILTEGLVAEAGTVGNTVGMHRTFSPAGAFCGGIVALSGATPSPTPTPTPGGNFPQLSNTGNVLTSYTPGKSLFMRSVYAGDIVSSPNGYLGRFNNVVPDVQAAGINTLEAGFLQSAVNFGCTASNFSIADTDGNWQSNQCGNFHSFLVNTWLNPSLTATQTYGMPWITIDFEVANVSHDYYDCGSNTGPLGSCTKGFAQPMITDFTSLMNTYRAQGMLVGQMSPDEFEQGSLRENGATNPYYNMWFHDLGMDDAAGAPAATGTELPHLAWGEQNRLNDTTNSTNPFFSDWYFVELPSGGTTMADTLGDMERVDVYKSVVTQARGPTAGVVDDSCSGPCYYKNINDNNYQPGDNVCSTFAGLGTGNTVDYGLYAVARGFVGLRTYIQDFDSEVSRVNAPVVVGSPPGQYQQTGCSPVSALTQWPLGNARGQDRWYAMSAVYNVIGSLEPYILQPMMAPPNQAQACDYDSTVSTAGDPIICGAHQGNGGRVVVIMNVSGSNSTFSFNPASYLFSGGTSKAYKIVGTTDGSCGEQTTTADAGIRGINDCVKGPTTINGVRWEQGTTMANIPAVSAPLTTTNIGSCGGQMCPTEADVFMYHQ